MSRSGRKTRGKNTLHVVCPSGKTGFKQGEAQRRLDLYADSTRKFGAPQRIYECAHCGHWHLTRAAT